MTQHWRIHRSRQVVAYLISLREEGAALRQAIDKLASEGLPSDAQEDTDEEPSTYSWEAQQHLITCIIAQTEKAIYVTVVQHLDLSEPQ